MTVAEAPIDIALTDEEAVVALAARLAPVLRGDGTIHLQGDLGAGKTTFARALLRAMGVGERIKSPTYSLIETYALDGLTIHHLDLYRIADPGELEWLGLDDLASGPSLMLIEWPERGTGALPAPDLLLHFSYAPVGRQLRIHPLTAAGKAWSQTLSG